MQFWIQAPFPHRVARKVELTGKTLVAALSLLIFSCDLQLEVNAVLLIILYILHLRGCPDLWGQFIIEPLTKEQINDESYVTKFLSV